MEKSESESEDGQIFAPVSVEIIAQKRSEIRSANATKKSEMLRYEITVTGNVQGIGYRYFVEREAQKLTLTGWVRNLSNGDVEIMAEGEKDILENFISILKTKHRWARIDDVKIIKTEISKKEFSDFKIVFY